MTVSLAAAGSFGSLKRGESVAAATFGLASSDSRYHRPKLAPGRPSASVDADSEASHPAIWEPAAEGSLVEDGVLVPPPTHGEHQRHQQRAESPFVAQLVASDVLRSDQDQQIRRRPSLRRSWPISDTAASSVTLDLSEVDATSLSLSGDEQNEVHLTYADSQRLEQRTDVQQSALDEDARSTQPAY